MNATPQKMANFQAKNSVKLKVLRRSTASTASIPRMTNIACPFLRNRRK